MTIEYSLLGLSPHRVHDYSAIATDCPYVIWVLEDRKLT